MFRFFKIIVPLQPLQEACKSFMKEEMAGLILF